MRTILETEMLLLRPLEASDVKRIVELINTLDVSRWLTVVPYPYTSEDAREFLEIAQAGGVWAICAKGELVGVIGLQNHEFGYWLGKPYWGKGYMSEAAFAVCEEHFSAPKAMPIYSGYFVENERSAAILRKLGFSNLGKPKMTHSAATGQKCPLQKLAMTPEQWHFLHPVRLTSERLIIEPAQISDAEAMFEISRHKSVAENLASFPHPLDMNVIYDKLQFGRWKNAGNGWFIIRTKAQDVVGAIGFYTSSKGVGNTGYAVHPDYWGKGYMSEAVGVFTRFLFDRFGFDYIEAEHFVDNPASGQVMIKNGFEKHGESIGQSKARLEPAPVNIYRLANPN